MKTLKIIARILVILPFAGVVGILFWLIIATDLTVEVKSKVELVQAMTIASVGLIGLNGIMLIEIVRNEANISRRLKTKPRDVRITRAILSWSIVIGLAVVMLVCFWFINRNSTVMEIAWLLFIIQVFSPFSALVALNLLSLS
jgi:hypothetical protein